MEKPAKPKERNMLRGAIRRCFARSEVRQQALDNQTLVFHDYNRPRVQRWCWCSICGVLDARSYMQADHILPLVPIDKALEDMTWTEVVDRIWCDIENLQILCVACHKIKSKAENKERKLRRGKKK